VDDFLLDTVTEQEMFFFLVPDLYRAKVRNSNSITADMIEGIIEND